MTFADVPNTASNAFALMYAEPFRLARQGVLEFSIPNQQPDGTAYGVIWRVQYDNGQNVVEEYIPQVRTYIKLHTKPVFNQLVAYPTGVHVICL